MVLILKSAYYSIERGVADYVDRDHDVTMSWSHACQRYREAEYASIERGQHLQSVICSKLYYLIPLFCFQK